MTNLDVDVRLKTLLNSLIILEFYNNPHRVRNKHKNKIEKVTFGDITLKQLGRNKNRPSVLFIKENPQNVHLHFFAPDINKNPFGVDTVLEDVGDRPKDHIHVDSNELISKGDDLLRDFILKTPDNLIISHNDEFLRKKVILYNPESRFEFKKNYKHLVVSIDYCPIELPISQVNLHEKRLGFLLDDSETPRNFIVVRNGEIFKYNLEKMDELIQEIESIFATDRVSGQRKI